MVLKVMMMLLDGVKKFDNIINKSKQNEDKKIV